MIEFLYEPDCSSTEVALARLREVMAEDGYVSEIRIVEVATDEEATALQFPGSPTIRIDGRDIDPAPADAPERYALTCRAYHLPDGRITPFPPKELLRAALRSTRSANDEAGSSSGGSPT